MERPAPVDITFSRLTYTIQGSRDATQYTLLNNVSGSCMSSRLTSILGPSGAGKTTLVSFGTSVMRFNLEFDDKCVFQEVHMLHPHSSCTSFSSIVAVI